MSAKARGWCRSIRCASVTFWRWTEALTRLCEEHTHVRAYEALKAHFTEEEQVNLTLAIIVINGWNRIAVGFGGFVDPMAIKTRAAAA